MEKGDRFGRLTVVEVRTGRYNAKKQTYPFAFVECECGAAKEVRRENLLSGATQSCGCLHKEVMRAVKSTHGLSTSPEYSAWGQMIGRCTDEKNAGYHLYGARGIKVCQSWLDFGAFIADMGRRPCGGFSLERLDNNGPYSKDNCVWADRKTQARNRRSNHLIELDGKTKTLVEWCEDYGAKYDLVERRINLLGWAPEKALTKPIQYHRGAL